MKFDTQPIKDAWAKLEAIDLEIAKMAKRLRRFDEGLVEWCKALPKPLFIPTFRYDRANLQDTIDRLFIQDAEGATRSLESDANGIRGLINRYGFNKEHPRVFETGSDVSAEIDKLLAEAREIVRRKITAEDELIGAIRAVKKEVGNFLIERNQAMLSALTDLLKPWNQGDAKGAREIASFCESPKVVFRQFCEWAEDRSPLRHDRSGGEVFIQQPRYEAYPLRLHEFVPAFLKQVAVVEAMGD